MSDAGATRPLRVLFLSSCVRGGGAGWSLYYLLKHLDRTRIEPLVVVPAPGIFGARLGELDVPVVVMPAVTERTNQLRFATSNPVTVALSVVWNLLLTLTAIPRLVWLIRVREVDLVHGNNMLVKIPASVAAWLAGVPCVLHVRNLHERPSKRWLYGNVARLSSVRRLIVNSAASAAPYQEYVPDKTAVVHNGIDLGDYQPDEVPSGEFRARHRIGEGTVVVGFTGNLIPRKGLEPLIRAAAQVCADRVSAGREQVQFVAVGRVPVGNPVDHRARLQAIADDLRLGARFRFVGFEADVRPAVRDFDILVLPSLQEPFGRSIIEAMALGTAVVASRVGGIPEIITDGRTGLLVEPGDVDGLAAAIGALVDDHEQRERLATAATIEVAERFDVARLTADVVDLLVEAAADR